MATLGHHGSWLGFTYNGIHSSALGITRTISGRFNENLIPTTKDTTASLEGVDSVKYWGTTYTKRDIPVSFAFEGMSETQLLALRYFTQAKAIHDLIFDEAPYKVYSAKITGTAMTKYIAFEEGPKRYYNGEGSMTFTCYFPYARSRYAWQEDYTAENIPEWRDDSAPEAKLSDCGNIYYDFDTEQDVDGALSNTTSVGFEWVQPTSLILDWGGDTEYNVTANGGIILYEDERMYTAPYRNFEEWIESSRIPSREEYGKYDATNHTLKVYNAGDIEMPMRFWFPIYWASVEAPFSTTISCGPLSLSVTNLARSQEVSSTGAGGDKWLVIDMYNSRAEGYDENQQPTGRLYDRYISGAYFMVPLGEQILTITEQPSQIDFNYLYL